MRVRYVGKHLATCVFSLAFSVADPSRAEAPFDFATAPGKLPKEVKPDAYRIDLTIDVAGAKFTANEEIDISVAKPVDTVILNTHDLIFQNAALKGEDGAKAAVMADDKAQTARLHFPHPLQAGPHTLAIAYSGPITAQPSGLYYADYDTLAGRKRMLVTQFETTDARRMFPGWDEPAFKATYTLSAVLPDSFRALSNTPVAHEEPAGPGLKKVTFATTPKMSSYLLVLVAGEMDRIAQTVAGTDIGVDTVIGKAEQGRFALETASQVLPYYNDYFAVKYPLPKLDLIGIPGNFAAGAMENWGGITYIDSDLLLDPATSSADNKQQVFVVVAHEMAHQWSGDLVTMAWWDNIWLNEGFASWMETKAADHFNPAWKVWLRAHSDVERAMDQDSRRTSHPIQQTIADESEADAAFDDITYLKGQSFLRMIENYLGEDAFRDGMRRYMAAHAYSNTTTADFWAAMEAASGKPVGKIAAGFTEQPGIPLVRVQTQCLGGETVATLSQDRFTIHDPKAAQLRWEVPVAIGRAGDAAQSILLGDKPQTVKFAGCGGAVKANIGDVGYYRAQYDDQDLTTLITSYKQWPAADRVNLLGDLWAMVEAGHIGPERYLDLTRQLSDETELVVWTQVVANLRQIDDLERGSPARAAFRAYARSLLIPVLARLGWDAKSDEPAETTILRALAIRALGRLGDPAVIAESKRRFAAFIADPASVPASLQDPVMAVVGHTADRQAYDALHRLGKAAPGTETLLRYYNALGSAGEPALIADTVKITTTDEITAGRVNRFIAAAAASSDNPDLVWKLFLPNRKAVLAKLSAQQADELLPMIAGASSNPAVAAELKALPEASSSAGARKETAKAIENIAFKSDFKTRLIPAVNAWVQATFH